MTALPSNPTKANLDAATDDPKQARSELATAIDSITAIIAYLTGLFSTNGEKATARSTLGVYSTAEVDSALAGKVDDDATKNTKTDSYTLTESDGAEQIHMNKATACTLTCPENATENLAVGFQSAVWNQGVGQVTIAVEGSDTLRIPDGKTAKIRAQYSWAYLTKIGSGEWAITGDLEDA